VIQSIREAVQVICIALQVNFLAFLMLGNTRQVRKNAIQVLANARQVLTDARQVPANARQVFANTIQVTCLVIEVTCLARQIIKNALRPFSETILMTWLAL
jgi:hypothetical protein